MKAMEINGNHGILSPYGDIFYIVYKLHVEFMHLQHEIVYGLLFDTRVRLESTEPLFVNSEFLCFTKKLIN